MEATPQTQPAARCSRLTQDARCNHVIEAAIRLFARKGFQGTKTKEIAKAAGINEALIFRDFKTKENLYCAILKYGSNRINAERWLEEVAAYAERRDDHGLFSNLALKFFENYGRERDLYRLMLYSALEHHELARKFRERYTLPVELFIKDYMSRRQQEGAFRKADPAGLARVYLNMCHHHVLRQVLFADGPDPSADAAAAKCVTEVFLDGVRSH